MEGRAENAKTQVKNWLERSRTPGKQPISRTSKPQVLATIQKEEQQVCKLEARTGNVRGKCLSALQW